MPKVGHPVEKGDLYARVEAQLPTKLSPVEREHYEALTKLKGGGDQEASDRMRRSSLVLSLWSLVQD